MALTRRWREAMRLREQPFAMLASVIANCNRDPSRRPEPYTEADFMRGAKPKAKIYTMTVEDQIEMARRDTETLKAIRRQRR